MMKKQTNKIKYIVIGVLLLVEFVSAHQNSVGVGVLNSSNVYLTKENKTIAIPIVNYTYKKFYIKAMEAGYAYNRFLYIVAQPQFNSAQIQGAKKREGTLDAGFKIVYPIESYKLTFKNLFDTLGVNDGYKSSLTLSRTFVKFPFIFIPNIGLEYQSKKSSDYYYGVDSDELYTPYELSGTVNKTVGFVSIFNIGKTYAMNFIYNYKKLDKDIENSPIVIKDNKRLAMLSVVYKF